MISEKQIFQMAEERREELVELLGQLVKLESTVGNEGNAQAFIRQQLEALGMEIDEWTIDLEELSRTPGFASKEGLSYEERPCLAGIWRGKRKKPALIVNGHIDVVEAGAEEQWKTPPFEPVIREGRLYGRGSGDMKGGIACVLMAFRILRELDFQPEGDIIYESTVGEEDSVNGTLAFGARGYHAPQALIPECSGMAIAPSNLGTISFNIEIAGKQAHHGLKYQGVSAFEKAAIVYEALMGFERYRTETIRHPLFEKYPIPATLNVGKVEAGHERWAVAPSALMECCCEYYPQETAETVWAELQEYVLRETRKDDWLAEHPPVFKWMMKSYASEAEGGGMTAKLTEVYRRVTGKEASIEGFPCGADMSVMNLFAGTPTILFGPGYLEEAHTANESVAIEDLLICTKVFALIILESSTLPQESTCCCSDML